MFVVIDLFFELCFMKNEIRKNFELSGKVVKGEMLGRKIGYPTINVFGRFDLPEGVYVSVVSTLKGRFKGALHYGPRKTFGKVQPVLEVHLLNFSGDLYDETVKIDVYNKIRDVKSFNDLNDLKLQIEKDAAEVALADVPL